MSYYSDDEDIDIRVERRRSPPVHYVDVPAYQQRRPRHYYPTDHSPAYLEPERTTIIATRSASRERSRERISSPPAAHGVPVVINNRIYNEYSSDDEESHNRLQLARPRRRSRSRSHSQSGLMTREEFEMERARRELQSLKLAKEFEERERRATKELQEEADLRRAKEELDEIKRRQAQADEEARIKKELELRRLKDEEREAEEQKRREKAAEEAVEHYKKKELERIQREKEEHALREREYQHRLQEQLLQSGLDEQQIAAILRKERVPEQKPEKAKPKYTRMARKHLSLETLRTFDVDYFLDEDDANYVVIKRWVPEWEQDALWKHTKLVREKRSKLILSVDDKKKHHHHRDTEFEWVRKKSSDRKRSKSPALLMYLAGARPA
ncbi:hypothetical protein jhhlp_006463 [Lomentospora prolificans]|uniref:Uncharacterized protein n=1 Tax=Lomentospora prolificans TaxID=41688 RepID=A0A2N3N5Z7_9PEZI|nr:hypothetical protein jhhlp_006463 [Lomentospora prolificans]